MYTPQQLIKHEPIFISISCSLYGSSYEKKKKTGNNGQDFRKRRPTVKCHQCQLPPLTRGWQQKVKGKMGAAQQPVTIVKLSNVKAKQFFFFNGNLLMID